MEIDRLAAEMVVQPMAECLRYVKGFSACMGVTTGIFWEGEDRGRGAGRVIMGVGMYVTAVRPLTEGGGVHTWKVEGRGEGFR